MYEIEPYGERYFAVYQVFDFRTSILVCVCLYKRGAQEVKRRLEKKWHDRLCPSCGRGFELGAD